MSFDRAKLEKVANHRPSSAIFEENYRMRNREWLHLSRTIALSIRYYLREEGLTQKSLAEKLNVSPAQISKILKGSENLTLETISALQEAIGHTLVNVKTPYKQVETLKPVYPAVYDRTVQSRKYVDKHSITMYSVTKDDMVVA